MNNNQDRSTTLFRQKQTNNTTHQFDHNWQRPMVYLKFLPNTLSIRKLPKTPVKKKQPHHNDTFYQAIPERLVLDSEINMFNKCSRIQQHQWNYEDTIYNWTVPIFYTGKYMGDTKNHKMIKSWHSKEYNGTTLRTIAKQFCLNLYFLIWAYIRRNMPTFSDQHIVCLCGLTLYNIVEAS